MPLIHDISVFGFAKMMEQSGMPYYLGEGVLLILGALLYAVSTSSVHSHTSGTRYSWDIEAADS